MRLIIGLGNPGPKYKKTRHNAGYAAIEVIASNFQFSIFNVKLRGNHVALRNFQLNAELSKGKIDNKKIILAKPQTFMNRSGESVKTVASYYKIKPENIWVIHDDIDLPLGTIRISQDGGSGGHKGVQSIINNLGTKDFPRFRIGIYPINKKINIDTERFVLENFTKTEEKIIKEVIKKTAQEIVTALKEKLLPSTILLTSKL